MTQQAGETFVVTQASAGEADVVAPLFDAYRQFYRQPPDLAGARDFLAARLAGAESVVLVARERNELDGAVLGFAQLYPAFASIALRRAWILYDLFVIPRARRRGVGQALLQAARELGLATGASELNLQTAADNSAAQALYTALGWQRDEEYLTYVLTL